MTQSILKEPFDGYTWSTYFRLECRWNTLLIENFVFSVSNKLCKLWKTCGGIP